MAYATTHPLVLVSQVEYRTGSIKALGYIGALHGR